MSSKKYILIIENDISFSENLRLFLSIKDFRVIVCKEGKEAVKICLREPPDLIICDILLPDINGFSLIQILKMEEPMKYIPFIFLSVLADSTYIQKGLYLGAKNYITKPVKVNKLFEAINNSFTSTNAERQSILLIEDDSDMRDNLHSIFTLNGYNVVVAKNGKEGLEKAFSNSPDLIVCDVMIPDLDGYSILEELKHQENSLTVPFIYLSAKSELSDFRRGMSLGADDYISKPFKTEDLLNSVKMRINKKKLNKERSKYSNNFHYEKFENIVNNESGTSLIETSDNQNAKSEILRLFKNGDSILSNNNEAIPNSGQISIDAEAKPENKLEPLGYNDPAFEHFLTHRVESSDYQRYCYNNILVILISIRRAVQKESMSFYQYLQEEIGNGYKKIVLEMTMTEFIDSSYAGVLISCNRISSRMGVKIKLVTKKSCQYGNPIIQQGLEKNFGIYRDLKSAIESY